jgi:hypothetical protein
MKKATLFGLILVFVATAMIYTAETTEAGETAWFDMENCDFCKNLVKDPKLLENMSWEHHDIKNGVLTITVVKPEFKESYLEAQKAMKGVADKMQSGEVAFTDVKMCGHCQNYGKLVMMGVNMEYVQGESADVVLMTSDDPAAIKEIQLFAQHNRDEMAKMHKADKK